MKIDREALWNAHHIIEATPPFCQDCGETDPSDGFYPLLIVGPTSLSPLLCKPCEITRRLEAR